MNKILSSLVVASLWFATPGGVAGAEDRGLPALIVAPFSGNTTAIAHWQPALGERLAEMLVTELAKINKFRILENSQLENGGWAGVDFVFTARVPHFGNKESRVNLGGFVPGNSGKLGGKQTAVKVIVEWRLVDAVSREIIKTGTATGEQKGGGFDVGGRGGRIGFDNKEFMDSAMGKATVKVLSNITTELSATTVPESARRKQKSGVTGAQVAQARPEASGTGFFISEDGFLITNEHVVKDASKIRLVTSAGLIPAKVVKVDAANDLALLKTEGKFTALPVASSRAVRLGGTVATVGFPTIGLQGFAPKLAKGEVAALSGASDDARYFQISVPVQPGNSGGALVDERGNVVGVVSAKLSAKAALAESGALPENVNYAVKSSFLLGFLESVPEVSAKLKELNTNERKFEDVVKSAEQAAVLVLVY